MRFYLPIVLLLSGCQFVAGTDAYKIRAAKRAVLYQLKDGESAKFRNVTVAPLGKVVCGEVNSKNAFGAYSGFEPFAYRVQRQEVLFFPDTAETMEKQMAIVDFPKGCLEPPDQSTIDRNQDLIADNLEAEAERMDAAANAAEAKRGR